MLPCVVSSPPSQAIQWDREGKCKGGCLGDYIVCFPCAEVLLHIFRNALPVIVTIYGNFFGILHHKPLSTRRYWHETDYVPTPNTHSSSECPSLFQKSSRHFWHFGHICLYAFGTCIKCGNDTLFRCTVHQKITKNYFKTIYQYLDATTRNTYVAAIKYWMYTWI